MARPLRIEFPGAFYHVIQRGIERKEIFLSDKDFDRFFGYIDAAYIRYNIVIHAYCLMKNHYHLIVETKNANLSKAMHCLNSSYTTYFNLAKKRVGHLYQGRYKAILVQQDEYLHHLSSYIHLNPTRAYIVKDPKDYPYSSYKYFTASTKPPRWLNTDFMLSMFDKNTSKAKALYKDFVLSAAGKEKDIVKENTIHGFLLGTEEYLCQITDTFLKQKKEDREIAVLRKLMPRPAAGRIIEHVESKIKDKRLARKLSVYFIRKYSDLSLKNIAGMFSNLGYTGVSKIYKRTEGRLKIDKALMREVTEIERGISV